LSAGTPSPSAQLRKNEEPEQAQSEDSSYRTPGGEVKVGRRMRAATGLQCSRGHHPEN
jgi:hypothetical protein